MLNLTQHEATQDQRAAGVVDLAGPNRAILVDALTFTSLPDLEEMGMRADVIVALAVNGGAEAVMIGGAPYFMPVLDRVLTAAGLAVHYAFSQRESREVNEGGQVRKVSVFCHAGFVPGGSSR